jgi:hypothetical protein
VFAARTRSWLFCDTTCTVTVTLAVASCSHIAAGQGVPPLGAARPPGSPLLSWLRSVPSPTPSPQYIAELDEAALSLAAWSGYHYPDDASWAVTTAREIDDVLGAKALNRHASYAVIVIDIRVTAFMEPGATRACPAENLIYVLRAQPLQLLDYLYRPPPADMRRLDETRVDSLTELLPYPDLLVLLGRYVHMRGKPPGC